MENSTMSTSGVITGRERFNGPWSEMELKQVLGSSLKTEQELIAVNSFFAKIYEKKLAMSPYGRESTLGNCLRDNLSFREHVANTYRSVNFKELFSKRVRNYIDTDAYRNLVSSFTCYFIVSPKAFAVFKELLPLIERCETFVLMSFQQVFVLILSMADFFLLFVYLHEPGSFLELYNNTICDYYKTVSLSVKISAFVYKHRFLIAIPFSSLGMSTLFYGFKFFNAPVNVVAVVPVEAVTDVVVKGGSLPVNPTVLVNYLALREFATTFLYTVGDFGSNGYLAFKKGFADPIVENFLDNLQRFVDLLNKNNKK